jgi:peptide/nickel transport system substrate-binding protein
MAGSFWDKYTSTRVSRRKVLATTGITGAAAGAALLVGCGGGDDDEPTTDETPGGEPTEAGGGGTPVPGGRYSVGSTADFDTFDPYIAIAASVGYFPRLYNVLANFSAQDSSFRFDDLSTGYEHPDDFIYNFAIRDGVKVGPNTLGVPERALVASDVVTSYERVKSLPQSNAYGFIGKFLDTQSASADEKTYTMTLNAKYAYFRNRIGSAINTIVAKEALADGTIDKLKQAAAGAGPYILKSYTEGQGAAFDRNPNYYRRDEDNNDAVIPYVEGIDVKIITDRAALRTAFQSDQLSVYGAQNVDEAKQLNPGGNTYNEVKDPVNTFIAFTMNVEKKPWDDDRIRKAVMHAINRQEYIDRVYSGEAQANGLVHWPMGDLALPEDERDELQKYDPAMSKQLINAATGSDTIKIKFMYPAESVIQEHSLHLPIFLEQLRAAGFEVEEDPQAFATWLDNYTNKNYEASLSLNQVYEYPEFNMDFQHSEGPARNNIYAVGVGKLYPEIDAKIDSVKQTTDPEEFKTGMHDLQRLIYEKGPSFLPFVSPYSFTMYQKYVKNIPQGLGSSGLWLNTFYIDKS